VSYRSIIDFTYATISGIQSGQWRVNGAQSIFFSLKHIIYK